MSTRQALHRPRWTSMPVLARELTEVFVDVADWSPPSDKPYVGLHTPDTDPVIVEEVRASDQADG